jgi:hypothetical protein
MELFFYGVDRSKCGLIEKKRPVLCKDNHLIDYYYDYDHSYFQTECFQQYRM